MPRRWRLGGGARLARFTTGTWLALAAAAAGAAGPATPASTAAPALAPTSTPAPELFARGASFMSAALSPDGKSLVYIAHPAGRRIVAVRTLGQAGSDRAVLAGEAGKDGNFIVQRCWFKTDRRILCHYSGTDFGYGQPFNVTRIVALDADGGNVKVLVQRGAAGASQFHDRIVSTLPDDPSGILIALDAERDVYPSVYRLDVFTGGLQLVQAQRSPVLYWMADRRGAVRFGYGFREHRGVYITRDDAQGEWRTLLRFERFDTDRFEPLGFSELPGRMLVSSEHHGRDAIWELDLRDQADLELVFAHPEVDVARLASWPADDRVVGFAYHTDKPELQLFDAEAAALQADIDRLLPGAVNRFVSASRDGRRLLVFSYGDTRSGTYYLLDLTTKSLQAVGLAQESLRDVALAPMRAIRVPGPAGLSIPGYLTLPPGRGERNLPAVVLPHGGPYARDTWGYDPLVQLLASRGYAVLQVNYRGSTGYGAAWLDAGKQKLGTVMHDDITAGARWLVSQGIADPARLAIVGWSYGGYAAQMGAIKEPGLYRCAVSIAGLSDLEVIASQDARFYGGRDATRQATGTTDLEQQSPRRRAAEVGVPLLLVHGKFDVRVLPSHSIEMARALKRAGKPHELLLIEHGDHALQLPGMRRELFEKLVAFLGQHLDAPAAQAAPAR